MRGVYPAPRVRHLKPVRGREAASGPSISLITQMMTAKISWYGASKTHDGDLAVDGPIARPDPYRGDRIGLHWQSVDAGGSSKRCGECGNWMLRTPGTNRSDREFCSDRCRVNAYRRRKKLAAQLHRKGMAFNAIAKKLGSDAGIVRGWLGITKKGR